MDGMQMDVDTRMLERVIRELPGGIDDLLAAAATEMVGDMVMGMQESPADGVTYTRGSREHVASSAGNPPRPDTGELVNSVTHTKTGTHEETIHDQVEHGRWQEVGTEFIEARPWMKPVFEAWQRGRFGELVRRVGLVR